MALVLPEGKGDPIREEFLLGDPSSNPGPGENFFS